MAGQKQGARSQSGEGSAAARSAQEGNSGSRNAAAASPGPVPAATSGSWLPRTFRSMTVLQWVVLAITLYGLGASIYLTIAHYDTSVSLVCSDKGVVNCEAVTTSSWSMVFGVLPVAVLGLAFYVFLTAVNSPWAWRWQRRRPELRWVRLGSLIVGMGFVLYLIYAETQVGAICLWCTSVHVATFLLFSIFVFDAAFNWGKADTGR